MPSLNLTHCLTAEQPLLYTWLTARTEHDLCDLRENFGLRSCWRNTIGAARACRGSQKVMARTTSQRTSSDGEDVDYTLGMLNKDDIYHVDIIRTKLTRNIAVTFKEAREELILATQNRSSPYLRNPSMGGLQNNESCFSWRSSLSVIIPMLFVSSDLC